MQNPKLTRREQLKIFFGIYLILLVLKLFFPEESLTVGAKNLANAGLVFAPFHLGYLIFWKK